MAELTISQLIKMVLFGFVIVIVIAGASMGFNRYIIPYFKDIGPSSSDDGRDFNNQFYSDLIKPENVIGTLKVKGGLNYFLVKGFSGVDMMYYIDDSEIYFDEDWGFDDKAGELVDYKININSDYLNSLNVGARVEEYNALRKLNGGEIVGNEVLKITSA